LEAGDKFGDLYAGKKECEVIQKIGKIVEMSFALLFLGQLLEGVKWIIKFGLKETIKIVLRN
jgi:hypothetical protein